MLTHGRRTDMKVLFVVFAGFCVLSVRAASTVDPASTSSTSGTTTTADETPANNTASNGTHVNDEFSENGCSFHQSYSCHPKATCVDIDKETNKWECICDDGLEGDGLKGENNTGCGEKECNFQTDCFPLAVCNSKNKCVCNDGYHGDGWLNCTDINECLEDPCHSHAYCNNTIGSYTCTCDERHGYHGNGSHCIHTCTMDSECDEHQKCFNQICECEEGYRVNQTDPLIEGCFDIDECEDYQPCDGNATCTNTPGSYTCECINGYRGDGETCYAMPMNCHDIKISNNDAVSGKYEIDPDFKGPLGVMEVDCEMRTYIGITIMSPTTTKRVRLRSYSPEYDVTYEHSIEEIKAVINSSYFCSQYMKYECRYGSAFTNGNAYLKDGDGNKIFGFGGSKVDDSCLCGELTRCTNRSKSCNCDGTRENRVDEGIELNKDRLPITGFMQDMSSGIGDFYIGEVFCAPKAYDFPKDCHEAKFHLDKKKDTVLHIDVDGEQGSMDPFLVFCDMESESHVGITHIPTNILTKTVATLPGNVTVTYYVDDDQMNRLISDSLVCQQELRYSCKNSRLLNNGDKKTYFWDTRGQEKDYWPYGKEQYNCGCGSLGNCANKNFGCNCDANDDELRTDYGKVTDKSDLPIGRITTLDVGGPNQFGEYFVGDLMCAREQFGYKPLCQDIVNDGEFNSQALEIDPDGPPKSPGDKDNEDPFLVYCEMTEEPPTGATIIYHDQEKITTNSSGVWIFKYKRVIQAQITVLIERTYTCTQTVSYTCLNAPLHDSSGNALITWTTRDGKVVSYFDGQGGNSTCFCGLTNPNTCQNTSFSCNCDIADGTQRSDSGVLLNQEDVPIMSLNISDVGGMANFETGPLICKDLYPNCAEQKEFRDSHKLHNEDKFEDGMYTIDPEGLGAFVVQCVGFRTIVPVFIEPGSPVISENPDEPVSKCFDVKYKSKYNDQWYDIPPARIQALVRKSLRCSQSLTQTCTNAPITGLTNYSTCDLITQKGWSGSKGDNKCSCGILGACKDGANCNCDVEDGKEASDGGWMHDKEYLAVCQVCVRLNAISNLPANMTDRRRKSQPTVSDLICDSGRIGTTASCQDWLNDGMRESGVQMLDVDGAGPFEPTPFYCNISVVPPMGVTEIFPKNPNNSIPTDGGDIIIEYYVYDMIFVRSLIEVSGYCTQEMTLVCEDSSLILNGTYGWYSVDGEIQTYWAGNEEGTTGCAGENGECSCNLPGKNTDGGLIIDKTTLPVSRVTFPAATGKRELILGNLKCFNLPKDCEEIRVKNLKTNPTKNDVYAIDTDGAGGFEPFPVICDFDTDKTQGISVIRTTIPHGSNPITNSTEPGQTVITVTYGDASYDQVHSLAEISGFCLQGIQYTCQKSPVLNFGDPAFTYFSTYGGGNSSNFGVADRTDVDACACYATRSCPGEYGCHCDAQGPMTTVDYGYITDRGALPAEKFFVGGQKDPTASATLDVSNIRCAVRPFDLPEDCQDAYERHFKSGEVLIQPNTNVIPFLVYCDMSRGFGVTIISNKLEDGKNVTSDNPIPVEYYSSNFDQLVSLTAESKVCFLPIKIQCRNSKLRDTWHWLGGDNNNNIREFLGYGRPYKAECNCGRNGQYGQCTGSEDKPYRLSHYRACNCDADDDTERWDAGIYNSTSKLPMKELQFENMFGNASKIVTLGKYYCADFDFDLDECTMGFNDCDEHATCINKVGYYECKCNRGYQALGVPDKWANGRQCYDDNECALSSCPGTADCYNNPGSFTCVCKKGYDQTSPTSCRDIDECTRGTHNCDENARCINLDGSFACKCNRNFKGNGTQCTPLAECSCFGDPHCLTYDGAVFNYQGKCMYTMARDKCDDLTQTPTFELLIKTDAKPDVEMELDVSWVSYAIFRYAGIEITLRAGREVWVDGERINSPYRHPSQKFYMSQFGEYMGLYTELGVDLTWDGDDFVEIRTPGAFKGQTCGFCGNYNDDPYDDLMQGPACQPGNQTDNYFVFGNSWVDLGFVEENPICAANCTPREEPECKGTNLIKAEQVCNKLWDINGDFKECLRVMNESILIRIRATCVYDACAAGDGDVTEPVCDSAKMLYQECVNLEVELLNFNMETICGTSCQENMTYMAAGPVNEDSCMAFLNNSQVVESDPPFSEGCFCEKGYYRDGDKCILPDDCGCLYEEKYFKIGDEITLDDCRTRGICYENHSVIFDDITCDENAECVKKDGRFGCHCKKGYYGDGVICKNDTCDPDPCGENEVCVRDPSKELGYECQCAMGFTGNCSNCVETDECATGSDGCPFHSVCINTVGSFKCQCLPGFFMLNGKCDDIDECSSDDKGASLCGNNSQCSNKIGGYECACCNGYAKDESDNCVENPLAAPGPKCCACDTAACDIPGEICTTDHQQYDSIKDLIVSNCENDVKEHLWHEVDYFGKCGATCDDVRCPKYQACVYNQATQLPTCECEECSSAEEQSGEVCTKSLITYTNMCVFKKIQCAFDSEEELHNDMKPCEDKKGVSLVSPWTPWTPCSVTCEKGVQSKSRYALKDLTNEEKELFPLQVTKDCYEDPCPGSGCINYTCERNAQECFVNDQNQPLCECRDCTNVDQEPVCGFVTNIVNGARPVTWSSECMMLAFICIHNIPDYGFMHEGHCGLIPEKCTRVPYMQYLTGGPNNTYTSTKKHSLNKCMGGCGKNKYECCQAVEKSKKSIPLKNGPDQWFQEFDVIEKCECVDISETEETMDNVYP